MAAFFFSFFFFYKVVKLHLQSTGLHFVVFVQVASHYRVLVFNHSKEKIIVNIVE